MLKYVVAALLVEKMPTIWWDYGVPRALGDLQSEKNRSPKPRVKKCTIHLALFILQNRISLLELGGIQLRPSFIHQIWLLTG